VILLLALVVLGPERLPDAIRRVGRVYTELKRMSSGLEHEIRSVIDEPMNEIRSSLRSSDSEKPETKPPSGPGTIGSPSESGLADSGSDTSSDAGTGSDGS